MTVQENARSYRGWRIVAVCFALAVFAWGFGFYGQGVYVAQLARTRGWSLSLVSTGVTAYYLMSALMVAFVSDWIRRFGARKVVAGGACAMGGGVALLGVVDQPWQLFGALALMSVGWASTSLGAITNIVGMWFSARRGLAISLALTGASAGGIIVTPALQLAVGAYGFERAMLVSGALLVALIAPLAFLLIETPPVTPARQAEAARPARWTRAKALRSAAFWSVAGPFAVIQTTQVAFLVHQISILEPVVGRAAAGFAVSLTTGAAVAGRLLLGLVVDRLDQRLMTALLAASQALAIVAIALWPTPIVLFAGSAVFGASVGNMITLPSLILQREFEPASFGVLVALTTAVNQMAFSAGPGLMGMARDAVGAYGAPLLVFALANGLAALSFVAIRPAAESS